MRLGIPFALAGLFLVAGSAAAQTHLGNLSSNPYNPRSTSNPYGAGSSYATNSIHNSYGRYGSRYSAESINNPYGAGNPYNSSSPAKLYGEGLIIIGDDGEW